jgi:hypothetical protein
MIFKKTAISTNYRIEPIAEHPIQDVYFGSTEYEIDVRFYLHKVAYNGWKRGMTNFVSAYALFDKYGVSNCRIVCLETHLSEKRMKEREAFYIQNHPCVNQVFSGITRTYTRTPTTRNQLYHQQYYRRKHLTAILFKELPFN